MRIRVAGYDSPDCLKWTKGQARHGKSGPGCGKGSMEME